MFASLSKKFKYDIADEFSCFSEDMYEEEKRDEVLRGVCVRLVVSVFRTDPRMCLFCSELVHSLINYVTRILVSKCS